MDEIGCAVIYDEALPEPVSTDMSISYMSTADVDVRIILSFNFQIDFKSPKTSKQTKNKNEIEMIV